MAKTSLIGLPGSRALKVVADGWQPLDVEGIKIHGKMFRAESWDFGIANIFVPEKFLAGFYLSDIPTTVAIETNIDIVGEFVTWQTIERFDDGELRVFINCDPVMNPPEDRHDARPYLRALWQAVGEREKTNGDVKRSDFYQKEDIMSLHYAVVFRYDITIEDARRSVKQITAELEKRRNQILSRS
jgi:hypothetical protein